MVAACAAALVLPGPAAAQNQPPVISGLTGPAAGTVGETLTYTVSAFDPDGAIGGYAFDLDGDGRFEHEGGLANVVAVRYDSAGVRNVGVRVRDDAGGVAYASAAVTISGAAGPGPAGPAPGLVATFRLDRPVFGGTKRRRLRVAYSVREDARVTVSLHRGGRRLKRLARRRAVSPGRVYRATVRPRGLARGAYTLRLRAVGAGGRTQRATLTAVRL